MLSLALYGVRLLLFVFYWHSVGSRRGTMDPKAGRKMRFTCINMMWLVQPVNKKQEIDTHRGTATSLSTVDLRTPLVLYMGWISYIAPLTSGAKEAEDSNTSRTSGSRANLYLHLWNDGCFLVPSCRVLFLQPSCSLNTLRSPGPLNVYTQVLAAVIPVSSKLTRRSESQPLFK